MIFNWNHKKKLKNTTFNPKILISQVYKMFRKQSQDVILLWLGTIYKGMIVHLPASFII